MPIEAIIPQLNEGRVEGSDLFYKYSMPLNRIRQARRYGRTNTWKMLACIACSKHEPEDSGDDTAARAPSNPTSKDAVKSLTSQLRDMVLKFSGTSRHCKGGSSSLGKIKSLNRHHQHDHYRSSYLDKEAGSDAGCHYEYFRSAPSSSSTPAWDFSTFANTNRSNVGEEEEGCSRYGGKWIPQEVGDGEDEIVLLEEEGEPREWMAQVEPGVHITFLSLPGGAGNDLKRIRFSREIFNKWQAQRWWGENYDRIMELYNVRRFSRQAFPTPPRSNDGDEREFSPFYGSPAFGNPPKERLVITKSTTYGPPPPTSGFKGSNCPPVPDPSQHLILPHCFNPASSAAAGLKGECSSIDASRTTTSSRASISISNASDLEAAEWVEQDEPGVYITIRELADGTRELRRVRFSRQKFGEERAKLWWEENRERIQAQYL
ncbi:protein BREVIS RADIX-like [Canna indica]|uniref:Protein BREVIS RADIX-like n=1 Tax=Canna indica TaxID=4628 RepID=A0AAQ3KZZ4_9LILI|nr:protein BREVIS RADIX-like [Canna indica]